MAVFRVAVGDYLIKIAYFCTDGLFVFNQPIKKTGTDPCKKH